jgi:hypothetical protein
VLFAATISEALRRFEYFDVWHLYRALCPQPDVPGPESSELVRSTTESLASIKTPQPMAPEEAADWGKIIGDRMYADLREWGERGLLDQTQISMLNYEIAKNAINRAFWDGISE